MKIKILSITLLVAVITACSHVKEKNSIETKTEELSKKKSLQVNDPILIHDSPYIIYPLILEKVGIKETSYDFGSKNRYQRTLYSNLIFLNTTSNDYHLLDENKSMLIEFHAITLENSKLDEPFAKNHFNKLDKWLYYSVIGDDFNNDGRLDDSDPTYLFISDKSGRNFQQISPRNIHIQNWRMIKGTNKIFMEGKKDSNNNKMFDSEDEVVPFSFVISKDKQPIEIFSEEFKTKVKKMNQ